MYFIDTLLNNIFLFLYISIYIFASIIIKILLSTIVNYILLDICYFMDREVLRNYHTVRSVTQFFFVWFERPFDSYLFIDIKQLDRFAKHFVG